MFVRAGIVYNVDTRNPTTKRQFLSRSKFREKGAWPAGMSDEQLLPRTGQCDVQEISFLLDKQIFSTESVKPSRTVRSGISPRSPPTIATALNSKLLPAGPPAPVGSTIVPLTCGVVDWADKIALNRLARPPTKSIEKSLSARIQQPESRGTTTDRIYF